MKINDYTTLNNLYDKIIAVVLLLALPVGVISYAKAAITPTLSVSNYQQGNCIQITVNADAYAPINLYNGGIFVETIGYTNGSGNFYTAVNNGYYNIPANSWVYVVVDGAASVGVLWPSYNSYSPYPAYPQYTPVTLSQTSLYLNAGQTSSLTIYGNGNYYISNDSNSSVASASINGSLANIYAYNGGSANITICQISGSCANLYVSVANPYIPPPIIIPQYYRQPIINYPPPPIIRFYPPQQFPPRPYPYPYPSAQSPTPYRGWPPR